MTQNAVPFPHLAARIFNTPLMIHPQKLDAIIAGLGPRLLGLDDAPAMAAAGLAAGMQLPADMFSTRRGARSEDRGYQVVDGVAVLNVNGALVHRSRMTADSSFLLGYNSLSMDVEDAMANADVHAVLLSFDSPGGEVNGAFEWAERMAALRGKKPMVAIADSLAASAGYLGACAADSVAIASTGYVGSIGVVMRHVDMSRALANSGVSVEYIYAGAHKVDGNPHAPLPEAVRADYQAEINSLYEMFVDAVAANRRMSTAAVRATEAAVYRGAAAVKAGLADRVATADQIIAELAAKRPTRAYGLPARNALKTGGQAMSEQINGVELTAETAFAQADLDTARAEGEAAGRAAGAAAERERIQSVEAQCVPGHEKLIASLKFDGITSGPEAAVQVLAAERKLRADAYTNMHAEAPAPVPHAEAPDHAAAQVIDPRALAAAAASRVASEKAAGRNITVAQAMQLLKKEA
ncbi:S49 family peptidase [Denitromonas halophila]|uniref:S49 family peptidase n=1 Tax=Denitromonas halophila TaxID=1629404 RepID=UPI001C905C44|nr:S49 family peptidase [Denitromonas halophila]